MRFDTKQVYWLNLDSFVSNFSEHIYAGRMETSEENPAPVRVISAAIGEYVGRLGPVWVEGEIAEMTARPGTVMAFMRLKDPSVDMSISVSIPKALMKSVT